MSTGSLVLLLALVAAGLWFWMRRSQPSADDPEAKHASPYHCVAIVPGNGACRTAQTLKGLRFLSAEAPTLPLVSCDSARCTCTFEHHADRRHGDRRNPYSAVSHTYAVHGGDERRHRRGRRQTDGMQVAHGL
ncbi:hypothetical protein G3580_05450 [Nitrogeniibacter mangrovi]|uniref:Uncharacterized protein n=1 Tax=Nitrogeniibacter mangrovi TaxID=2016596 RepID=A0A6C1B0K8_9RHOO|nr:hypothetical protein [Nitrogeniibacter mangrovi]QID17136.1 hypothetical protein G3580_05450 [Nitrogeniibacter mangrovi]